MQLLLYAIIAIVAGIAVAAMFRFKTPGGTIGSIIAGLLGAWIGGLLIREIGPTIGIYYILPGFIGAFVVGLIIALLGRKANIVR